ncbi:MAG: sensor histidine kinase KdpD [Labilithrix sp.]|nr:sensor histidine kinase KdpD [Labilithrix sp.]MBX3223071.1 sensor histidine kinase KdpD [Labilithrix sp.]
MVSARPDPDELLLRVQAEERRSKRGRLTIFFGAAPGVGKTFAMLQEAGVLLDVEQRDVVAGVVETHGRFETTTLLAMFERLPRRKVTCGSSTLEELDLDGALARKPSLLLLDELAHTNAPGCRHAKRWQDAEELLDAGIDVYTTLNVQHVESLNDVVAQVTGVVVRETVPDAVIDSAHEVKLIDLPPDELLERLREGKVYLPAQAEKALENFFQKGNLLALRELALRKTAERVDAEIEAWRRAHGIEKTWAATDRLLVCIGASPYSANLLRVGRRMAASLHARWYAVNVETPAILRLGRSDRARISQNLRLAEQLGAETTTLTGERQAEEILRFARERNVTKIVVGKPRALRFRDRFGTSFVDELLLGSGDIDVYATVGEPEESERAPEGEPPSFRRSNRTGYLAATGVVALVTTLALVLFGHSHSADVVMMYLLGIVLVATRFGFGPSVLSGVLSVLAFDFFFSPPFFAFAVADVGHALTFAVMLLVAVVIAKLTQRVRDQAELARLRERRTALLYAMSRQLSRTEGRSAMTRVAARNVEQVFDAAVAVLRLDKDGAVRADYATDGADVPFREDDGVIRWVHGHRKQAGRGTGTLSGSRGFYVPLVASGLDADALGVLGIYQEDPRRFEDPEQQRLVDAFATLMATSIERAALAEETERARVQIETEQLRSTLLSSVSHDLRTPLAVMRGAASALVDDEGRLSVGARNELASALLEETDRLDRQVRNLLDMTRLESGAVRIKKEWQPVEEVLGAAFNRIEPRLARRAVTIHAPAELVAEFDGVLVEQVVVNLLENAAKYTPEGSPIDVTAWKGDRELIVEVADRGAGIPPEERRRIFDKFHRGASERTKGGVGLGLTICRAIVAAHGGRIWVAERPGGGASFRFSLPLEGSPPVADDLPEIAERASVVP